jgi:acyl-CoA dehydrogenase
VRIRRRSQTVDFEFSARTRDYLQRLGAFMDEHIYPNEERFYAQLSEGNRWEEPSASIRRGCWCTRQPGSWTR